MAQISDLLINYFPALTPVQKEQFDQLHKLYEEWNGKINVISRKDIEHLAVRHILHSLSIARFIDFKANTEVLDVGTGGGFPSIPLAIFFPEVSFRSIDSIGKKIKVVNEVSGALGLSNIEAFQTRAENDSGQYDFVVSRAVTRLKPFLQWIKGNIKTQQINDLPNGLIALKGGDLVEELREVKRQKEVIDLAQYFTEPFFETKKIVYLPLTK